MTGLEYFAFDTHLDTETTLLFNEHGANGMCMLVLILQSIYGDKGYYMPWNKNHEKFFSQRLNTNITTVQKIISSCIQLEIFDNEMYEQHGILTSASIQSKYAESCKRRKKVEFISQYLLTDVTQNGERKNIVLVNKNCIHDVTSPAQSKVKESKVKKSIENNNQKKTQGQPCADPVVVETKQGVYEEVYGKAKPSVEKSLQKYLDKMDRELVVHVLTLAKADSKPWSWVTAVLENHLAQGTRTLAEFQQKSRQHSSSPPKNAFTAYSQQGNYDIDALERRNLEKRVESVRKKSG